MKEILYIVITSFTRLFCFYSLCFLGASSLVHAACKLEIENSNQVAQKISNEWPLRNSQDKRSLYTQKLGLYIVSSIESGLPASNFNWPSKKWNFLLMRDLTLNAYSIGNGIVYITDGTFNFVKTEAEFAAIIAHEIAHQLLGHFCQNNSQYTWHRIGSLVQVLDNKKEIEADALAVRILNETPFPPQSLLDIVKQFPMLYKTGSSKESRIEALELELSGVRKKFFSSSPEFIQIKHLSEEDNSIYIQAK